MIINQLLKTLYSDKSPYLSCDLGYVDNEYPHTNIDSKLLETLFSIIEPNYIVECGSMLGGSAIRMAKVLNGKSDIICIDPFTGDVNMWNWEAKNEFKWKFLRLENGIPTIYKRFLANCAKAGFNHNILPINCTTTVGIKLLYRLYSQRRISALPNYIYLDSAHEPEETLIELKTCWSILGENSVLFGDDWGWEAVKQDVIIFSELSTTKINYEKLNFMHKILPNSSIHNNKILLFNGQWVLFK